jgi:tRNA pseudouridine38-40 synthase
MADSTLKLVLSYDGTGFAGSQVQPGKRTVQAELERALAQVAGQTVQTVFAGRTDTGVHAVGQVVSCPDARPDLATAALRLALNAKLADDVAVGSIERKAGKFHARFDAAWREYRYRVWAGPPQPLAARYTWQRRGALSVDAMAEAAERFVGERDLAALAGGGEGVPWSERSAAPRGTVRRILRCRCRPIAPWWGEPDGTLVDLRIVADGFLPRMVRNIAALLVEVGHERKPVSWIDEVLASRDRRFGGGTAPPQGLTLWRVGYGMDEPDPDPAMTN